MSATERRDLVIRLAERVLGWKYWDSTDDLPESTDTWFTDWQADPPMLGVDVYGTGYDDVSRRWSPLTDLADAWMLVDALRKRGCGVVLTASGTAADHIGAFFVDGVWAIAKTVNALPDHNDPAMLGSAFAPTMPLAICKAAMAADAAMRDGDAGAEVGR